MTVIKVVAVIISLFFVWLLARSESQLFSAELWRFHDYSYLKVGLVTACGAVFGAFVVNLFIREGRKIPVVGMGILPIALLPLLFGVYMRWDNFLGSFEIDDFALVLAAVMVGIFVLNRIANRPGTYRWIDLIRIAFLVCLLRLLGWVLLYFSFPILLVGGSFGLLGFLIMVALAVLAWVMYLLFRKSQTGYGTLLRWFPVALLVIPVTYYVPKPFAQRAQKQHREVEQAFVAKIRSDISEAIGQDHLPEYIGVNFCNGKAKVWVTPSPGAVTHSFIFSDPEGVPKMEKRWDMDGDGKSLDGRRIETDNECGFPTDPTVYRPLE